MTKTRFVGGTVLVLTVAVGVLAFGPWTREAAAQEGSEQIASRSPDLFHNKHWSSARVRQPPHYVRSPPHR